MIADEPAHVQTIKLPDDLEPLVSIAKMLRMSHQAAHRHLLCGADPLPAYRLGGRWFASRSEVLAWVARRSRPRRRAEANGEAR
jgi:hypothetical protein